MQKYTELISELVQKEGNCFLPGIGVLKLLHQPAKEDRENNQILPPEEHVVLETQQQTSESELIIQMAVRFNQSKEEARAKWEEVLVKMKAQASKNKPVNIPGLGQLQLDAQQQWEWKETTPEAALYKPLSYTFNTPDVSSEEIPPYEYEKTNKRKIIYLILGIVALLVIGYFAYRYVMTPPGKQLENDPSITPTESTPPPLASTPSSDSTRLRNASEKEQPVHPSDSIHYAVIFDVFHSKEKAEHHFKRMRNWGHSVSLYTKDSTTFRMGYAFYSLPADTTRNLEKIRKTYGGNPFIIYPEK